MLSTEPQIRKFMTPCSGVVSPHAPARIALALMRQSGVPFLPVVSGKRVIGILKERTVKAALTAHRREAAGQHKPALSALDLMKPNPTVIAPDTCLYEAIDDVPESAYGCTVIQKANGEVAGIFSSTDALLAMSALAGQHRHRAVA